MSVGEPKQHLSLVAQIVEDWKSNGRDWTKPGFQALAVHRFGNWRMGIGSKLARAPFSVAYRTLFRGVRNFYGIELPYSTQIGRRVVIEHQGAIVIHGNAVIARWEAMMHSGETAELAAELLEQHYDPSYERAMLRNFPRYRNAAVLHIDDTREAAFRELARQLLERTPAPQAA